MSLNTLIFFPWWFFVFLICFSLYALLFVFAYTLYMNLLLFYQIFYYYIICILYICMLLLTEVLLSTCIWNLQSCIDSVRQYSQWKCVLGVAFSMQCCCRASHPSKGIVLVYSQHNCKTVFSFARARLFWAVSSTGP